jgi:SulP family sulfate permease
VFTLKANHFSFLLPDISWIRKTSGRDVRKDLVAGVVGSILAFPQAIALAILAGMPPQYGIYASLIPVLVALIWGSSWFTLSGPNTAVSVMLAATIIPFAALGSDRYIELILLLSLSVGLIQLLIGFFKLGVVLDFISSTVILAITQAVAIILLVSAIFSISLDGVAANSNIFSKIQVLYENLTDINLGTFIIGLVTIAIGLFSKLLIPRYYLLIAMLVGTFVAFLLAKSDNAIVDNIPLLGAVPLTSDIWLIPKLDRESISIVASQWHNALAIAFLGLMQTVIISRSIAVKSGQTIDTGREIIAQGLANTVAPFTSAFAGSGSFNRSATNFQAGAKSPYAGIFGVLLLLVIVILGQDYLGIFPKAVIAATLFLVGFGLLDFTQVREIFAASAERWIFIVTFLSSLILGLNIGVLVGVFSSLMVYLWYTSQPNINIVEYLSRNGKTVKSIGIDGNLFFGSIPAIETKIAGITSNKERNEIIVIKTDHLSYIDVPGARLIIKTLINLNNNGQAYVTISRSDVLEMLKKAGLDEEQIRQLVIFKDKSHPMKSVLYPYQSRRKKSMTATADTRTLVSQIKKTALMSSFSDENIDALLENNPPRFAESGEIIVRQDDHMNEHLILIDGEIEVQRTWSVPNANDKSHTWTLFPKNNIPAELTAASSLRIRALSDIQYVLLNANTMDALLGWMNQESAKDQSSSTLKLMQKVVATHHFPQEILEKIVAELTPREVEAGDIIIRETEKGKNYYLIEDGEAEVIRTDPFTDETSVVSQLGAEIVLARRH